MERNRMLAALLILAIISSGCGMSKITQADVALEDSRARARTACVEARARAEEARMRAISTLPEDMRGMAIMGDAMVRQSEAVSEKDPCGQGLGAYDIRAVEVREKNATARAGMKNVASGSEILYGIDRFSAVAEKGIKSAGDRTTITGDGNSYGQERVTSNSEIATKNFGENGTATSGAPTTSGPDKSSTVTEIAPEPAVEEPVIEEPEGEFKPTEPPDFPDVPVDIPGPESAEAAP